MLLPFPSLDLHNTDDLNTKQLLSLLCALVGFMLAIETNGLLGAVALSDDEVAHWSVSLCL